MELIFAGLLGYGLFMIRKQVVQDTTNTEVDLKYLTLHLLAFGLYLASSIIQNIFYARYMLYKNVE